MMEIELTRRGAVTGLALAGPMLMSTRAVAADPLRLIGVIEEDPAHFNPAMNSNISSYVASCPVYSALTRMDADGNITGDLAERWEISPDGKTYTFHLRKNITWHDGKPFSSADVVFSLGQINSKLHPYRGAMTVIQAFEAPDPDTVVLRLGRPLASLIYTLHAYAGVILPKHLWANGEPARNPHNKNPVGTGPYKFAEYLVGDRIRYVKNDKYFRPGQPAFDELVFRIIPDAAGRVAAFEKGEVDMVYSQALPATEVERLSKLPGVEMKFSAVAASAYQAFINMRNPPFSDVRVRQALAHAIDRDFIRKSVFPGLSAPQVGHVPPSSPLYNKNLKDYALDPARANQLLDEAGFPRGADGKRFNLRYLFGSNDLPSSKICDILAQNLGAVGINVIKTPLERATLLQRAYGQNEFDMVSSSFSLAPDPDVGVERFYNSANIKNVPNVNNSAYSNPEVDRLFDEQRIQTTLEGRKAIYDRIQDILWRDMPVFVYCAYSIPGAVRTSLVTNIFNSDAANRDDFAFARPAAATAAPAAPAGTGAPQESGGRGMTYGVAGAVVAAVAGAALWLFRRRSAKDASGVGVTSE